MTKIRIGFLFPLLALAILIFSLSTQLFNVPPLGKLLNPFSGAVQNDHDPKLEALQTGISKLGLKNPAKIYFDERKVPHIFAANTEDLYFTQGYVTASLRLWQMDFITYVAAGRLSELFDQADYLDFDRNQRRIGLLESAKTTLKLIEQNPETDQILTAYAKGVNAYINSLDYKQLPLEYKIMDYRPEAWTKLKSVLILKALGNTLSGYEEDVFMSKMMLALGEKDFNRLFPDYDQNGYPVMNKPQNQSLLTTSIKRPDYLDFSFLTGNSELAKSNYNPKLGSNSWVVSGKKTRSGFPILASDPHLNLNLPCFWVEMQLSAPKVNVYGVSIPGTPAVIIGFNQDIAWGITNGADDVKDWYKLKISADYKKYELDGKWIDLKYRVEEIKRKGQRVFYDTVYHTVHGPVVNTPSFPGKNPELKNYALRWTLHNPSNEFYSFIKLNMAKNYQEYKEAIRNFSCPVLNFTFAGKDNTIAIDHRGAMPLKTAGQGKFLMDGTKSDEVYTQYIPIDSLPAMVNPASNYLLTANQHPTNPGYSYYYNGYYTESRASRINQLLNAKGNMDVADMEQMQLDNVNTLATFALPILLAQVDKGKLSTHQKEQMDAISKWPGSYNLGDTQAIFFDQWLQYVRKYTWDELRQYDYAIKAPSDYLLIDLIREHPDDIYFDKLGTTERENAKDIITAAFVTAYNDSNKLKKDGLQNWGDFNKVNITHMTAIPAFGMMNLRMPGNPDAINAVSSNWGPSWRMIVALGNRPRAYGIYPGGQSGNIGSLYYSNFIGDWKNGKYYELHFFINEAEAKKQATATWLIH